MKSLVKSWKRFEKILENNFFLIIGITCCNIIPFRLKVFFLDTDSDWKIKILKTGYRFIEFFLVILLLCFALSFIKEKIVTMVLKIFFIISLLLFAIEISLFKLFSIIISPELVQILLETNKNEAFEFFSVYFKKKYILYLFMFTIIIYFIYVSLKYLTPIMFKYIIKRKVARVLIGLLLILKIFNLNFNNKINFSLYRLLSSINMGLITIKEYKEIDNMKNNIEIIKQKDNKKNIVLIIGESTSRNHMSLYGYKLDTNPLLKKLEKEGNLYKFTDTISPHCQTIPSIRKVLTFYNLESKNKWNENNNIIDVMNVAGYNTYWFSNQSFSGFYDNIATALGTRSKTVVFNSMDSTIKRAYDEEIIRKSEKYVLNNNDNNFIIYHLIGTHMRYEDRYPKSFSKFQNKNSLITEYNKNSIIAKYDNAILYNDYIINKIIDIFKDKESIVIYISDHGEEVYDFGNFVGHVESRANKYMVEIPFLIYVSNTFKVKYPKIVEKIEKSVNKPYMTDDLIHTILDIAEIETKEYDKTRSIINNNFNSKRKRIYSGKEYDTYRKNN